MSASPAAVEIVVDAANVVGSRPDGWWRDRAAAATRLVQALATLPGQVLPPPAVTGNPAAARGGLHVDRVLAVVEGQARQIPQVSGVSLIRSVADGDADVVRTCRSVLAGGRVPVAVTADRGLRERLPQGTVVAGPRWLMAALDRQADIG
ncbi:MAG TPA: hypothetical protein VI248_13145 [Kineosporiaceae bacterium]